MYRQKWAEKLFYFVFGLWFVTEILFDTSIEAMIDRFFEHEFETEKIDINFFVSMLIFVLLMTIIIFFQRYTLRELIIVALITLPIALATINSSHRIMMSVVMFIVASKEANFYKMISVAYIILLIMLPLIILLCFAGVLQDVVMYRNDIVRHSLGFLHPNRLGLKVFQLISCHYCIRKGNLHIRDFLYMLFALWFVYYYPNTQTAILGILILFVVGVMCELIKNRERLFCRFLNLMVLGSSFICMSSVYLSIISLNGHPLLKTVNKLLSYRFHQCHRVYSYYGLSWFGKEILSIVKDKRYVGVYYRFFLDNAYMSILLRYGIIVFVIFMAMYILCMRYHTKCGNYSMVVILFVYSIYGIMEAGFYSMAHNIFLLVIGTMLFNKDLYGNNCLQMPIKTEGILQYNE